MSPPPITRAIAAVIAVLIGGSTYGIWARDHSDHQALTLSRTPDVASCSVASAKHVPGRDDVTIRHIRFEAAPPFENSPSVILRFDMRNDSAAGVTGIVVSVSLFGSADRTLETSPLLQQPLRMRVNAPLPAGYSLDYEIRLKNLSLESACMSEVVVVADAVSPSKSSSVRRRLEKDGGVKQGAGESSVH